MDIIHCNLLKNIIGFDIGNGLTTPILRNNVIPCSNIIQFIMPEINIFHSIKIYVGNNILSKDNILLTTINITSPEKVIYIQFSISYLLYFTNMILVIISTKTKILNILFIPILEQYLKIEQKYIDSIVDIDNYKLKFELLTLIDLLKNKIIKKEIILSIETTNILYEKMDKISTMINELSNQKILDIKNNLKTKFFL
jgi:hypothetical protein